MKPELTTEMKTAQQHNAEQVGSLQLPPPLPRKERAVDIAAERDALKAERDALKGLVQDLRALKEESEAKPALLEVLTERLDSATGPKAILLPGGTRVVLSHIESYAPGGDMGIHFKLDGGAIHQWTAPDEREIQRQLGWDTTRGGAGLNRDQMREAMLQTLDRLFDVGTPPKGPVVC